MSGLYAVVLAGGRGSRFWPLSREDKPKPFLPFGEDGASQLSATCRRLEGVVDRDRVLVVAGAAHAEHIREQLPELSTGRFLPETQGRGTAAAVALAARAVYREDPEGLLLAAHRITRYPQPKSSRPRFVLRWIATLACLLKMNRRRSFSASRPGRPLPATATSWAGRCSRSQVSCNAAASLDSWRSPGRMPPRPSSRVERPYGAPGFFSGALRGFCD